MVQARKAGVRQQSDAATIDEQRQAMVVHVSPKRKPGVQLAASPRH
jgi:hypothetical protein